MNMQELTREEKDRLGERLMPGELICWQGKPLASRKAGIADKWLELLLLCLLGAVFGSSFLATALSPFPRNTEAWAVLLVTGVCCLVSLSMMGVVILTSVQKCRQLNATLYALTTARLLTLEPSLDGRGVLFSQMDGASVRKCRIVTRKDGCEDLIFRYRFPPGANPEPQGWLALPDAEAAYAHIKRVFPGIAVVRPQ